MAITHGTEYRYKKGCRCASCRRAHAEARRKERRAARRKQVRDAEISHLHIVAESSDGKRDPGQTMSRHHSASVVDAVSSFTAPMWDGGDEEAEMLILTMLKVAAAIDAGDSSLKPLVDALRSLKRDLKALTDKEDDGGLGDILGGMGHR